MKFYRYHNFGDSIQLLEFYLVKETLCGYWINRSTGITDIPVYLKNKWVSKTSRKRFAYPTKEEALNSFKHRKLKQLALLKSDILFVESVLDDIDALENGRPLSKEIVQ